MSLSRQLQSDLLLLGVVAIWGSTFPLMKGTLEAINPYFFIALRFFFAFLALCLFFPGKLRGLKWGNLQKGFLLGLCLLGGYLLQIVGLQYTTASRSGFITGLSVVLVPLLTAFILKEMPNLFSWVGVALATLGLFLMTGADGAGLNTGDFLTLLAALFFALQIVYLSKFLEQEDPILLTIIQIGVVSLSAFVISFFADGFQPVKLSSFLVIIYTGIMATALAYLIQSFAQRYTSPTHTGLIFTLEPLFAALFSWMILGELISGRGLLGGGLILLGMLLAELKPLLNSKRRNFSQDA